MKALILSCGGSSEPLQFCIDDFKPDFIYFLCSEGSQIIVDDINKNNIEFKIKILKNHESLEDAFAFSCEIINELKKDYDEIHVDFTGGTKPMVSGLVLAVIGEKCTYSYVGTENFEGRDKNGLGIVKNGFEHIKSQRDPYDVFAVMEFNKGIDFFNKYQFAASRVNFIQASQKLESDNLNEIAKLFSKIVDIYDSWDKFNNKYNKNPIHTVFKEILKSIESSNNLNEYFTENHPDFLNQLKNNIEFLNIKGDAKIKNVKYYLPDLLNNAQRRIKEGKYDDAVARLYRAIELIAQVGLCNNRVIDEHSFKAFDEFQIKKSALNGDAYYLALEWYEFNKSTRTFKIPLKKSYELLEALGSEFAGEYLNDDNIKKDMLVRNKSILAHGLNAIDKKKAEDIYERVFQYSKKAFPDIVKYIKMSKFPKFND